MISFLKSIRNAKKEVEELEIENERLRQNLTAAGKTFLELSRHLNGVPGSICTEAIRSIEAELEK